MTTRVTGSFISASISAIVTLRASIRSTEIFAIFSKGIIRSVTFGPGGRRPAVATDVAFIACWKLSLVK